MKSQGLQLEDSQLATAERLVKLATVATKAACIDIQLTQERDGLHQRPASDVFSKPEIETLAMLIPTLEAPPSDSATASAAQPGMGRLAHRSPRWLELLLQAPGTDYLPPRHGTALCHP